MSFTKITLDPRIWVLGLLGTAFILLSLGAAFAGGNKMQDQMIGLTAQLDGGCSATLIHSKRDDKSGDVSTIFLTAKHCVDGKKSDLKIDMPVYHKNRLVKRDSYVARVKGEWFNGDLALIELRDKQTFFDKVAKIAPAEPEVAIGDAVWTVGYPLGWSLTITNGLFGVIETQDFAKPGTEYYRATPDIAGGELGRRFLARGQGRRLRVDRRHDGTSAQRLVHRSVHAGGGYPRLSESRPS